MRQVSIFVVRPKRELQEKLLDLNPSARDLLLIPTVWSRSYGGCHSTETLNDVEETVKLLFLAKLTTVYLDAREAGTLLGGESISTKLFDRWWSIEAFDGFDEEAEEVAAKLPAEILRQLAGTDNECVSKWFLGMTVRRSAENSLRGSTGSVLDS